jgi:hypothetical protein
MVFQLVNGMNEWIVALLRGMHSTEYAVYLGSIAYSI